MKYVVTVRDGREGSTRGYLDTAYIVTATSSEEALLQTATFLKNLPHEYARSNVTRMEVTHADDLTYMAKALAKALGRKVTK